MKSKEINEDLRQKLITILIDLSSVETWEGVNKRNARAIFETYADIIIKLFEGKATNDVRTSFDNMFKGSTPDDFNKMTLPNDEIDKKIEETLNDVYDYARFGSGTKQLVDYEKELSALYTEMVEEELGKVAKEIGGMAFDKEKSDITQGYQSTFLDGYNQAIEEVEQYLLERKK